MIAYLSLRLVFAGWGVYGEWYALTQDGEHFIGRDIEMDAAEAKSSATNYGFEIIGEIA